MKKIITLIIVTCLALMVGLGLWYFNLCKNKSDKSKEVIKSTKSIVQKEQEKNITNSETGQSEGKEFEIEDINLLSSYEDILKTFGEPISKSLSTEASRHHPDTWVLYFETWTYQNVEFTFFIGQDKSKLAPEKPGNLITMSTSDERFYTKKGIKVGDSIEKLKEKYEDVELHDGIYYCFISEYEYMNFIVKDNKISKIVYSIVLD